jgi:hypothetical protein
MVYRTKIHEDIIVCVNDWFSRHRHLYLTRRNTNFCFGGVFFFYFILIVWFIIKSKAPYKWSFCVVITREKTEGHRVFVYKCVHEYNYANRFLHLYIGRGHIKSLAVDHVVLRYLGTSIQRLLHVLYIYSWYYAFGKTLITMPCVYV